MLSHRNPFSPRPMFSNLLEEFLVQGIPGPKGIGTVKLERNSQYTNMPSVFDVVQKVDDENNTVVTRMLVPGLSAEQVDVSVDSSIVSVVIHVDNEKSEEFVKQIYSAHTHKSFQMSTDYDAEQTQVDLTDGVLTLTTPRIVKTDQTVKLPINTKAKKSKPELGK